MLNITQNAHITKEVAGNGHIPDGVLVGGASKRGSWVRRPGWWGLAMRFLGTKVRLVGVTRRVGQDVGRVGGGCQCTAYGRRSGWWGRSDRCSKGKIRLVGAGKQGCRSIDVVMIRAVSQPRTRYVDHALSASSG